MKTGRKVFWGILLLLGALALLVGRMGYFGGMSFWSILFSIALVGIFVDGIFRRSFGTMLFAAAFFVIVNDKLLGMEAITPWPVLGAALLGTIGLGILFPQKKWKQEYWKDGCRWKGVSQENVTYGENGDTIHFENSFNESIKYIASTDLSFIHIENSFGSMNVYFDNAVLKENRAGVHVENSFGSTVLYVPRDWKVILNVENVFGTTKEKGHCNPGGENILEVHGEVSFGDLNIIYL